MKSGNKPKTRLDIYDRLRIQASIERQLGASATARKVGCSRSTLYRELKSRSRTVPPTVSEESGKMIMRMMAHCPKRKFPYVCNTCAKKGYCRLEKRYYDYQEAQDNADELGSIPRSHSHLPHSDIGYISAYVSPLIRRGQSLHHIYASSPAIRALCSERTLRRLVYRGELDAKAHELIRYVRFSHAYGGKKRARERCAMKASMLDGRTKRDFDRYTLEKRGAVVSQFDSVAGRQTDQKAILTIEFPAYGFQIGRQISKGSACSVLEQLRLIERAFESAGSAGAFDAMLCDNGPEFARFYEAEGIFPGSHAFYADPYKSNDKAACERNHELIRYVIPKGVSMDSLDQEKINLLFSHVNSLIRKGKGDRAPYDLFRRRFGKKVLDALGIRRIDARSVYLKPELLLGKKK